MCTKLHGSTLIICVALQRCCPSSVEHEMHPHCNAQITNSAILLGNRTADLNNIAPALLRLLPKRCFRPQLLAQGCTNVDAQPGNTTHVESCNTPTSPDSALPDLVTVMAAGQGMRCAVCTAGSETCPACSL